MINDVKKGAIDCIIVKDLSRFGRNYIEVVNYIEKIFPFFNVRFISINDNFDSFSKELDREMLPIYLKALVHDSYTRNLSANIKAVLDNKRKDGIFIGNHPSYGYRWHNEINKKFMIDEEVSHIIKKIFNWKLEKLSNGEIARRLNKDGVLAPGKYLYSIGYLKNKKNANKIYWEDSNISKILANEVYIGNLAQGKYRSIGNTVNRQDKSEWIIVKDTHESIIDIETFQKVQKLISEIKTKQYLKHGKYDDYKKDENIFKGLIKCGECEKSVKTINSISISNKTIKYRYSCVKKDYHKSGKCVSISNEVLKKVVEYEISNKIETFLELNKAINQIKQSEKTNSKIEYLNKEITLTKQNITKKETILKNLYEDLKESLLSKEEYTFAKERYMEEHKVLKEKLSELILEKNKFNENFINENKYVKSISSIKENFTLTREILECLVEKIILNTDKSIEIQYKFKNEYEDIINFAKENGVSYNG